MMPAEPDAGVCILEAQLMFGDCHVHAVLDGGYFKDAIDRHSSPDGPRERSVRFMLEAYHDLGITFLRDGGDRWGASLLAKQLAPEYGIEYLSPHFPIYRKGNYGSFIGRSYEDMNGYRALVQEAWDAGADFIKVMFTGIMDFDRYGVVTGFVVEPQEMRDMISIAHEKGLSVMAHTNGARAVQSAVEAGVDSIEHGCYSDEESRACLAESKAIWVPTFSPVCDQVVAGRFPVAVLNAIAESQSDAVADVVAHGGTVALGSDAGAYLVPHGKGTVDEYSYMKRALGDSADEVLAKGEAAIRERFTRQG